MAINPYGLYKYQDAPEEPQGDKAATSQNFKPTLGKDQLRNVISSYKKNANLFKPEQIDKIRKHAIHYNVPFYEGEFSIGEALSNFAGGFLEGFTTIPVGEKPPDNEYEAIARNVGHLLGFAPNMLAKPLKLLGLSRAANVLGGIRSIPLGFGEGATKLASKVVNPLLKSATLGRVGAASTVSKFLTGGATKSVIEEGFKLGVASAVSNWKQGIDGMIEAGIGGAKFGAAFGLLGNVIPGKGAGNYGLRAVSGSLFQGLPATQRGATTPEQVYEYLLGAYFGGGASGWKQKGAQEFFTKKEKQAYGEKGKKADVKLREGNDPTDVKNWKELDPEIQKEVLKEMNNPESIHYDPPENSEARKAMHEYVAHKMGIEPDKTTLSEKGWQEYGKLLDAQRKPETGPGLAKETETDLNRIFQEKTTLAENLEKARIESIDLKGAEKMSSDKAISDMEVKFKSLKADEQSLLDLEPGQFIDKKSGDIVDSEMRNDGNDLGMFSGRDLLKKSEKIVDEKLKEVWDKDDYSPSTKRNEQIRLSNVIDEIITQPKYASKGQKVDVESLVKEIETNIKNSENVKIKIDSEMKNDLRQFLTRNNFGEPVKFLNVRTTKDGTIDKDIDFRDEKGFTYAGNRKALSEPKTEVQKVLEEITGTEESSHAIFDNVTTRGNRGEFLDMALSKYRAKVGKKAYDNFIKKNHESMEKKGFYPFGGKGDNDTIIYIKKHPNMTNYRNKLYIKSYVNKFNKNYFDTAIKRNKYFTKFEAQEQYLSNVMWDISLNGFKPTTRAEYNQVLDKLFKGKGYIKNATAWNKRQQIWFTPTWRADKDFVANSYRDYLKTLKGNDLTNIAPEFLDAVTSGNVRYIIARDLDPKLKDALGNRIKKLNKDSKNTEYDENVDGMTIVEDNYLNSLIKDSGLPESGQSKNFIVSPDAKNGALLGKHMMHSAGKEASRQMREAGIQMIMQESAVKQRGERGITDYDIKNKKLNISDPNLIHEMPVKDIKYGYNVKQSNAMAGYNADGSVHKHGIPKQLLMAMSNNTFKSFPQKLINDFFNETIYKQFKGDNKYNTMVDEYLSNPTDKLRLNILEKNIDKVGINEMLKVINGPPTQLSDAVYFRLMKLNKDTISSRIADGEMTPEEGQKVLDNINEFNSSTDRIIQAAQEWSIQEKMVGRQGNLNPVLLHKYIRPYRFQVIRNYVFQSISKPKIGNSGVARMRGYDKWFRKDPKFKELETNDEVFYLDNSFKKMPLKTHISGHENTTLERLWNAYTNKNSKLYQNSDIKDTLRALTVRVPMDSTSGAQAMDFGGFTGRNGHGILMHSRAMRAEGGADLDGDEAFVFFGGRKGAKGDGFRKEWTEQFHKNKDEYLAKDGSIPDRKTGKVPGTKLTYEQYLTTQDSVNSTGVDPKMRDSKAWQYDSGWRQEISERAVDGRNLLGGAVTMGQVFKAAHSSLTSLPGKKDVFKARIYDSKSKKYMNVDVSVQAKTGKNQLTDARQLSSSMSAFTSDPLDVAGLTGYTDYFNKLSNSYFNIKFSKKLTQEQQVKALRSTEGIIGQMQDINSALYSRDYINNRSFDAQTIKEKTMPTIYEGGLGLEKAQNTFLPKMGKLANSIELYDSPFKNINTEYLSKMYTEHNAIVDKLPEFKRLLNNLSVPENKLVKAVANSQLWRKSVLDKTAYDIDSFYKIINSQGSPFAKGRVWHERFIKGKEKLIENNYNLRKEYLRELVKFAEDVVTQDVSDMVSFRQIYRFYDTAEIGETVFNKMLKKVSDLRRNSYLQRKNIDESAEEIVEGMKVPRNVSNTIRKTFGEYVGDSKDKTTTRSQSEIDAEVSAFKKTLPNARAQKLFDMLMLGSFRNNTSETSISKLGFSSQAVDKASVTDFIGDYATVMNKAYEKVPIDKRMVESLEKGDMVEKDLPENTILKDTTTGYEGLHSRDSKLPKNIKQELTELVENMKFYNGKIGQNLNELVRGVIGKDFNTMQYKDFVDLNNYFKELRRGTIFQRLFGDKSNTLKKRYTMLFPATVGRETMKYDIELLQKRGLFVAKGGKVVEGDMLIPTNFMEKLQYSVSLSMDKAQGKGDEQVGILRKQLEFIDAIEDGEYLRRVAVRKIESDGNSGKTLHSDHVLAKKWAEGYLKEYNTEMDAVDFNSLKSKMYTVSELVEGKATRKEYSGEQLVDKIETVYKNHFNDMFKIISGNKEFLDSYQKVRYGKKQFWDFQKGTNASEPIYDYKRVVRDINKAYEKGEDITTEFGVDGLRHIARSMMVELQHKYKKLSRGELRKLVKIPKVTEQMSEGYWPHMFFDKVLAKKSLESAIKTIQESSMSQAEKNKEIESIEWRAKTLTGDWITGTENWETYDRWNDSANIQKKSDKVSWFNANQMTSSMHSRTSHIPGWSIDATVAETYSRNVYKTYYKQLAQILSRNILQEFDSAAIKKGWNKGANVDYESGQRRSLMDRWSDYYKLYVQDAMGHPSIIPDYMINDPGMKLKGTPYAWWSDNNVTKKVNKIGRKLGLKQPVVNGVLKDRYNIEDVRHWSNLEAKYELMSLLAHPKSMVNNLFGGSLHTVQSVGASTLRKVYDYNFLRTINPEWTNRQALKDFVTKEGIFPEMLQHEWGMQKELQSSKSKEFLKDLGKKLNPDGTVDKVTMRELADKHNIGAPIMKAAAKFMSGPEMRLRTDAFMAHYIKAWNLFGGAITQHNHPFLIEMAKKGVKATQFLYNAPFRPGFARTALGKVMTRFQLWSWNATRFRNDVIREARIRGYRSGTPEYQRFKRTAQNDLLIYALGSVFAMSLFDLAIPAPLNHFKETSEWLFGDDKTRDRAFWGMYPTAIAPLQMITPPIGRIPISILKTLTDDNYNKFFDYHVYTMFPFGRIARDIAPFAKGNVLDNPYRTIEKFTGLPYGDLQKERTKYKKELAYHPVYKGITEED